MIYDHIDESLTWVRHLSKCHNLIQQNSKGPNVRFDTELVIVDGLWSSPLHREFSSFSGFIHIFVLFLERKKVCGLSCGAFVRLYNVSQPGSQPGSQVVVYDSNPIHYLSNSENISSRSASFLCCVCAEKGPVFIHSPGSVNRKQLR